jgi:hypothetical protein
MKAAVHTSYGPPDVVRIAEVDKPTAKDNQVLVRVHATTVNRTDCGFRAGKPQGPGKVGIRPRLSVDHGVAQRHATALAKPDARFPLQACSGILVQTATLPGPWLRK